MSDRTRSLKVSFGAFSCTVEGFDDPHAALRDAAATMSRIAADDPAFVAAALSAPRGAQDGAQAAGTEFDDDGDDGGDGDDYNDGGDAHDDDPDGPAALSALPPEPEARAQDALALAIARIAGRSGPGAPPGAVGGASGPSAGPEGGVGAPGAAARSDGAAPAAEEHAAAAAPWALEAPDGVFPDTPAEGAAGVAAVGDASEDDAGDDARDGAVPADPGAPHRGPRPAPDDVSDDAVDRLMGAAGDRLGAPETSRRLSAMRRLRHAVRAGAGERVETVAARALGPYGEDLDRAIGRRAEGEAAEAAPLVLVSSQRIDGGGDAPAGHRPRLDVVAREDGARGPADRPAPEPAALSAAWRERGAETLEDRMAVAAGLLDPEGAGFARPALMDALRAADPARFGPREERLAAFAALLEDGRLRRLGRGLFAAPAPDRAERL